MWTKMTAWLLWCSAASAVAVVATQQAVRTWLSYTWVVASLVLALVGTVMYRLGSARQKRWQAGNYDD